MSEALLKQRKKGESKKQTDIDEYEMRLKQESQY